MVPPKVNVVPPNDLSVVSDRWKTDRNVADFLVLKDTLLGPGTDSEIVVDVLGEPYSRSEYHEGVSFWAYVKCDAAKKQYYAWSCVIGADGKVVRWHKKGIM